jgi:lipoate-protein ligase A
MKDYLVIERSKASANDNMMQDRYLLQNLSRHTSPILHFYDWEGPSATYGHFIDPLRYFNHEALALGKINVARRPTGGGIIFHTCDYAFSVLVPSSHPSFSINTLENYGLINRAVIEAVHLFLNEECLEQRIALLAKSPKPLHSSCQNFCMAQPTQYDVMIEGRKVGGAAQRRTKDGFLHQGTIALGMPSESYLTEVLLESVPIIEGMKRHGFSLLGDAWSCAELETARKKMRRILESVLRRHLFTVYSRST